MQEADNGNENYVAPFTLMKGMYCFYHKEERDVLLTQFYLLSRSEVVERKLIRVPFGLG